MKKYLKLIARQSRLKFKVFAFLVLLLIVILSLLLSYWEIYDSAGVGSGPLIPSDSETIYVLSLPRRNDRRTRMEHLRTFLGLNWTYIEATSADEEIVERIMGNVRRLREEAMHGRLELQRVRDEKSREMILSRNYPDDLEPSTGVKLPFEWPASDPHNHSLLKTQILSSLATFDIYSTTRHFASVASVNEDFSQFLTNVHSNDVNYLELVCATRNFSLAPYSPKLPNQKFLTPARVACWHSHLMVLKRIVERNDELHASQPNEHVSIILEDDVDMEKDIRQRLAKIWRVLPNDWDIVFLGHCWSNESFYPAVESFSSSPSSSLLPNAMVTQNTLHPSYSPRCTHAYALSPYGATKILKHLEYPPFAYSRAIDQAYAWLVSSERVKAYSIVGSLAVQVRSKGIWSVSGSVGDVWKWEGGTSGWKESLFDGVLGS